MDAKNVDDPSSAPAGPTENETTGLPGLHTWTVVYLFVLGIFLVWVLLLATLSRMFS